MAGRGEPWVGAHEGMVALGTPAAAPVLLGADRKAEPLRPVHLVVADLGDQIDEVLIVEVAAGLQDVDDEGIGHHGRVAGELRADDLLRDAGRPPRRCPAAAKRPLAGDDDAIPKEAALRAADAAARPPPMTRTLQASSAGLTAAMTLYLELPASRPAVACRGRAAGKSPRATSHRDGSIALRPPGRRGG